MRRFGLAAVTCLHGVVACGSIWGFEDPILVTRPTGDADGGPVVETPVAPGDPTRTCVPKPPTDWQGPLIIFEGSGSPAPELPSCLTGYRSDAVYDGNANLVAPDATCKCECGPETGASCVGTLTFYSDKGCKDACPGAADAPLAGACTVVGDGCNGAKLKSTFVPGTCAPNLLEKPAPPAPVWQTRARVCAPVAATNAGCPSDRIATPTTSLPFETNTYCIAKSAEDDCPAAMYPRKRVYYKAFNDDRDCECTCGTPAGGDCTGSNVTTWDNDGCSGSKFVTSDGICNDKTGKSGASFTPQVTAAGTCAPASKPKNNATPTTPTTICCTR